MSCVGTPYRGRPTLAGEADVEPEYTSNSRSLASEDMTTLTEHMQVVVTVLLPNHSDATFDQSSHLHLDDLSIQSFPNVSLGGFGAFFLSLALQDWGGAGR